MNQKPSFIDKISRFVSGKGFYLVVLVCIAAIGLSGFFLVRSLRGFPDNPAEDLPVTGTAAITASPFPTMTPRPQITSRPAVPSPTVAPTPEPTPTVRPDVFVSGDYQVLDTPGFSLLELWEGLEPIQLKEY